MARREFTAGRATTLASAFSVGATSFTIADDGSETTWPTSTDYDFFVTIDAGTAQEERVLCSARSGRTITVATGGRGKDSTGEKNHAAGATVWPSWSAQDADESNAHIESSGYSTYSKIVHGLGSGDGVVVGTDKTQELKSKTINLVNNTLSGTTAQFNTALSDANFATEDALASHTSATTSVHGIADTSKLPNIASSSAGRTIFVQAAQPTALAVGDIWFQVTGL
jgi:hypothetical protein